MFFVATEGRKTEPQYFAMLNSQSATVWVHCLTPKASAPASVRRTMDRHLAEQGIRPGDEAWLVVDKDRWPEAEIDSLCQWASAQHRGLAVSNPKFEYWLLLHFEDGAGAATPAEITRRLRLHLPEYDKGVNQAAFPVGSVAEAVTRARRRDSPPCRGWPRQPGQTTVYRLVERILEAEAVSSARKSAV
ncbi:MAG: RloB family protein [Propionibacteriaceae bacterium]|nr:RloB family protein [Propionibacteriaceae bacterium]